MELVIPPGVADELIREGVANSADSRGLLLPGGDELATVLTLWYTAATAVTLIVDAPEAARIIARKLAFWRRAAPEPPVDQAYRLSMYGPNGYVEFRLNSPPDVDALAQFLESVFIAEHDRPM